MKLTLVLNRDSGTLRGLDPDQVGAELAEIFSAGGHQVTTEIHSGEAAIAAIARWCKARSCEAIVVGGGDGSVSAAAAAAAADGEVALGILPLGTMNLFARSLDIPLEMRAAARALAGGSIGSVDIGVVNGRFFIHHVTFGLHPRMVRARERLSYSSRLGKIWANIRAWWIVLRAPHRLAARIRVDAQILERRTAAILVTNNTLGEGHLPYADDLRKGELGLYVTKARRWRDFVQLSALMTMGEIAANPLLESWRARDIEITLRGARVMASVDGEIASLDTPVRLSVRAKRLRVIRPAATDKLETAGPAGRVLSPAK